MPDNNELFDDEFMNDMLLNPNAYGIPDGLEEEDDDETNNEDKYT